MKIYSEVKDTVECSLWDITTQGNRQNLPHWARSYLNNMANFGVNRFGLGDRTACYSGEAANTWICNGGWVIPLVEDFMDAESGLSEAADKVHASAERYVNAVNKLRSEVKNDIASIASTSAKAVAEISKVDVAINKLKADMTSPEMLNAIANAERLAAALQAISAVQSNNITFAVLGTKTE